ncbi:MAG: RDD family protein [Terriglobia bacterium]
MKCPGCGFVSFPDGERCKQCGHEFDGAKDRTEPQSTQAAVGDVLLSDSRAAPLMEKLSSAGGDGIWADELPERVASYRRRRAGIHGHFDSRANMKFDFDHEMWPERQALAEGERQTRAPERSKVDVAFVPPPSSGVGGVDPGATSLEERPRAPELRPRRTINLEDARPAAHPPRSPKPQPVIRHEPVFRAAEVILEDTGELPVASVGQRSLAGIADSAIILLCGGLFAGIFLVSGGHLHAGAGNLAILGLVGSALVFGYFGTFAAITHATPGDQWMGISIRNLEGEIPTTGQSLLRAFGYLVAAAAFMIGFLWIVMDSGGMGWHDHMSGTLPLALGRHSQ